MPHHAHEDDTQPMKRARHASSSESCAQSHGLFAFNFLWPLLVRLLTDGDVLCRMLPTCTRIKPLLLNYRLKAFVSQDAAVIYRSDERYLPVIITKMKHVHEPDLSSFDGLVDVIIIHNKLIASGMLPHTINRLSFVGDQNDSSLLFRHVESWDQPLHSGMLPPSLTYLTFARRFSQNIPAECLPHGLLTLDLGHHWNHPLQPGSSLTELTLGSNYEHLLPGVLPASLNILRLLDYFDSPLLPDSIPPAVQELTFGYNYNQPLSAGLLPANVKTLEFGASFNQPLTDGVLPRGLNTLKFGIAFNQSLAPGCLPPFLESLHLSRDFNHPLQACSVAPDVAMVTCTGRLDHTIPSSSLPHGLLALQLGHAYNHPLEPGSLPSSITDLTMSNKYNYPLLPGVLPARLIRLQLGYTFDRPLLQGSIPYGVEELTFGDGFNQPLHAGVVPATVKTLKFGKNFCQLLEVGVIPRQVKTLIFGGLFNHPLAPGCLPVSIQCLRLGWGYNQPLHAGSIPPHVTELDLGYRLGHPLVPGVIPITVQRLSCGPSEQLKPGSIPFGVRDLTLTAAYNHPLPPSIIPKSVTSLELYVEIPEYVQPGTVPDSVTHLKVHCNLPAGLVPSSVRRLEIGDSSKVFRHEIFVGMRRPSDTYLTDGGLGDHAIVPAAIPRSVTHLVLGRQFIQNIDENLISPSVIHLDLHCTQYRAPIRIPRTVRYVTWNGRRPLDSQIVWNCCQNGHNSRSEVVICTGASVEH